VDRVKEEVEEFFFGKLRLDEAVVEDVSGVGVVIESLEDAFEPPNPERLAGLLHQVKFRRGAEVVLAEVFSVKEAVNAERNVAPLESATGEPLEHLGGRPGLKNAGLFSEKRRGGVDDIVSPGGVAHVIWRPAKSSNARLFPREARFGFCRAGCSTRSRRGGNCSDRLCEAPAPDSQKRGPIFRHRLFRVRARRTRRLRRTLKISTLSGQV